jgi:hypothetical protein
MIPPRKIPQPVPVPVVAASIGRPVDAADNTNAVVGDLCAGAVKERTGAGAGTRDARPNDHEAITPYDPRRGFTIGATDRCVRL